MSHFSISEVAVACHSATYNLHIALLWRLLSVSFAVSLSTKGALTYRRY